MHSIYKLLVVILLISATVDSEYILTDEEYAVMPPVFHLDDFDRCMELKETLYCSVHFRLEPLEPSNASYTWKVIQATKQIPKYYRHDNLRHSICLPLSCPNISYTQYKVGNADETLRKELSKCLSAKYEKSGIKGEVTLMHCEDKSDFYPIETYDIIVAIGFFTLLALVIYASLFEGLARYKSKQEYEEKVGTKFGKIIACFSIPKNFARLKKQNVDPDTRDLKGIQGIRFCNMICVILSHTVLSTFVGPVSNTKWNEFVRSYNTLRATMIEGHVQLLSFS